MEYYVHIYVSVPPYQSISKLVQYLKGKSSRKIQQEFSELKKRYWGKHLWAVGYFVRTTGNVTDQMIKAYIEKHESVDDNFGDFQVEKLAAAKGIYAVLLSSALAVQSG